MSALEPVFLGSGPVVGAKIGKLGPQGELGDERQALALVAQDSEVYKEIHLL